ncbi:MAG: phosphatase PAP2 family protein [Candidatus Lokiarchaeota archaeon]|nr:phosphatase PAP2 family protein [Candidatus Lokiarchaeota archaeon]MBD3199049.1 phosphatase PAP2 family protein [Candidatus Lokiarchaeota archaeon]
MIDYQKITENIIDWDYRISHKHNGKGGEIITLILKYLSFCGKETIWVCLISFFLLIWYEPIYFSYIGMTFAFGILIIVPIKKKVNRIRPFKSSKKIEALEKEPTSGSFPSWHSYNVCSQALMISFLSDSYSLAIILIILAILISYSRIQLGVHFATDVVMGGIIGILGFIITYTVLGPFIYEIITIFEKLITFQIAYRTINPLFTENIGYIIICIFIYSLIITPRLFDYIKDNLLKK